MMSRSRLWVAVLGGFLAAATATVLTSQLPAALARDERAARVTGQQEQLAELESETSEIEDRVEKKEALLAEVREEEAKLARSIRKQERLIESLNDRIDELGG